MSLAIRLGISRARGFAEGQVWSYQTRIGEASSRLLINKIEYDPNLGLIYHISISDVRVNNPGAPSGFTTKLQHAPVSRKTLEQSCIKVLDHASPNPEYLVGYSEWKIRFTAGDAGVFTVPVSEIVDSIEKAINQ